MEGAERYLRERIGAADGGAVFWPGTCFVEISAGEVERGGWDKTAESLLDASGLFHEHIHWTQCHATTYGIFSFLCRFRRSEIIECFLRSLAPKARSDAFRNWEQGIPLWRFDLEAPDEILGGKKCRKLVDHWNCLLTFDLIFRHGNLCFSENYDFGRLFKIAFMHTDGRYGLEEIFQSRARFFNFRSLKRDGFSLPRVGSLSCRALEECAAFLNQRDFYGNAEALWYAEANKAELLKRLERLHDDRWEMHLKDPTGLYSSCIEYFCDENRSLDINDENVCAALLAIIDISLNPPLPPFVNLSAQFPENGNIAFSIGNLGQIHPVLRFVALVEAIRKTGLPKGGNPLRLPAEQYNRFVTDLCANAGLPDVLTYISAFRANETRERVLVALEDSPLAAMKRHVLQHHLHSMRVRHRFPSSFASPLTGIITSGALRDFLSKENLQSVFLDPMQIVAGTGYFAGMEERDYFFVLSASAFSSALTSLLSGQAEFYEDGLPQDEMHNRFVRNMQNLLRFRMQGER